MVSKGYGLVLSPGDAELIMLLLVRYRTGRKILGIDDRLAEKYIHMIMEFQEVVPDGYSPHTARARR
jgi:hypothetical protein